MLQPQAEVAKGPQLIVALQVGPNAADNGVLLEAVDQAHFRHCKKVRQRVIATLGRLDQLQASGALDRLLQSGADSRTLGPALVFERL